MEEIAFEKDLLSTIIKSIVSHPDEVIVERSLDERGVLLTLKVNQEDMGKVLGKKGQTAHAVRRIMRQYGMGHDMRLAVRIEEPEGSTHFQEKFDSEE